MFDVSLFKGALSFCFLLAAAQYGFTQSNERLAQLSEVTEADLINPESEDWLIWRRTYDAQGYSPL